MLQYYMKYLPKYAPILPLARFMLAESNVVSDPLWNLNTISSRTHPKRKTAVFLNIVTDTPMGVYSLQHKQGNTLINNHNRWSIMLTTTSLNEIESASTLVSLHTAMNNECRLIEPVCVVGHCHQATFSTLYVLFQTNFFLLKCHQI